MPTPRRGFIAGLARLLGLAAVPAAAGASPKPQAPRAAPRQGSGAVSTSALVAVDLPPPRAFRGGWAALSAVMAARGWQDDACADARQWYFHDGGGNWAALRAAGSGRALLFGHDHEYSRTYFGEAATYFGEPETDLCRGAPAWWRDALVVPRQQEWVGFAYGWDGEAWSRAAYEVEDGFTSVGLLRACSMEGLDFLADYTHEAPGRHGTPAPDSALRALVDADGEVTAGLLEAVVPGWDIAAGVAAARRFREFDLG